MKSGWYQGPSSYLGEPGQSARGRQWFRYASSPDGPLFVDSADECGLLASVSLGIWPRGTRGVRCRLRALVALLRAWPRRLAATRRLPRRLHGHSEHALDLLSKAAEVVVAIVTGERITS